MLAQFQSSRFWTTLGAILAGMAVILGAYGGHAIDGDEKAYANFMLSVQYHMWHALALLAVGWQCNTKLGSKSYAALSGILFTIGIFMFSGNLYIFAITGNPSITAAMPIGGLCFIGGWIFLAVSSFKQKKTPAKI